MKRNANTTAATATVAQHTTTERKSAERRPNTGCNRVFAHSSHLKFSVFLNPALSKHSKTDLST